MKTQYANFNDFLATVEAYAKQNVDYHVSADSLRMAEDDKTLEIKGAGEYGITDLCHRQIAEKLQIPTKYYDAMTEIPGLRSCNVNAWIEKNQDVNFIRTQDGRARAMLSNAFQPIDHFPICKDAVIPALLPFKNEIQFRSLALSERNMFIQDVYAREGEGIVLKDANDIYRTGEHSPNIWKVKKLVSEDYVIVGFEDTKSDAMKAEGIIVGAIKGGLYIDGKLEYVGNAGALTKEMKREFTDHPEKYIGKVIEVQGNERFSSGCLRHPCFYRWRPDKKAEECKL